MALRLVFSVLCVSISLVIGTAAQFRPMPRSLDPERASTVISGTVYGSDGIAISDARVELRDSSNGMVVGLTTTQSNGSFAIYNIPVGNYELVARAMGSEARELLAPGRTVNRVDLRLSSGTATEGESSQMVSIARLKVPAKARDRYDKAAHAFAQGKFDQAEKAVNESLAIYPDNPEALSLRGLLACRAKDPDAAMKDFQRSIDLDPNYELPYTAMSSIFNSQGKFDEATRTTERAIAINPNAWQGYFEMSKALLGKGLYQRALQIADRAETLGPQGFAAFHLLKAYAMVPLKLYKDAATELQAFLSHAPDGQDVSSVKVLLAKVQDAEVASTKTNNTVPGMALMNH
jgi:tetratricopeptide (TPR) repeat protein